MSFPALFDTGGHYCILSEEAAAMAEDLLVGSLGPITLQTARGRIRGDLYILRVIIFAAIGEDLDVEVVTFISPDWHGPSVIGFSGASDRFRFAVDPQVNRFFFACLA